MAPLLGYSSNELYQHLKSKQALFHNASNIIFSIYLFFSMNKNKKKTINTHGISISSKSRSG